MPNGDKSPVETGKGGLPPMRMPGKPNPAKGERESSPAESSGSKQMTAPKKASGGVLPPELNA